MSDWQPIATAPKGTDILLAEINDGYIGLVERGFFEDVAEDEPDKHSLALGEDICVPGRAAGTYWCCHYEAQQGGPDFSCSPSPYFTHWMLLPKP